MLKITTHIDIDSDITVFALEGRLAGPWVAELERCWKATPAVHGKPGLRVDLSGVTYIDAEGKALLARMHREGADLIAAGCLTKSIVEEILRAGPFDRSSCGCENESAPQVRASHAEGKGK
ncbi:MAG: STAS domain-containing protein [Nitrospiraceae bacterium]